MSNLIAELAVIILPAAAANIIPPVAMKVFPTLSFPADFGLEFRGKRILGDHKTIRGFVSGTLAAHLLFLGLTSVIDTQLPVYFGAIIGFAALLGDAIKSFIKRQFDIAPGRVWFPFDQLDWIIASLLTMFIFGINNPWLYVLFFVFGFCGHLFAKLLGFYLGINKSKI